MCMGTVFLCCYPLRTGVVILSTFMMTLGLLGTTYHPLMPYSADDTDVFTMVYAYTFLLMCAFALTLLGVLNRDVATLTAGLLLGWFLFFLWIYLFLAGYCFGLRCAETHWLVPREIAFKQALQEKGVPLHQYREFERKDESDLWAVHEWSTGRFPPAGRFIDKKLYAKGRVSKVEENLDIMGRKSKHLEVRIDKFVTDRVWPVESRINKLTQDSSELNDQEEIKLIDGRLSLLNQLQVGPSAERRIRNMNANRNITNDEELFGSISPSFVGEMIAKKGKRHHKKLQVRSNLKNSSKDHDLENNIKQIQVEPAVNFSNSSNGGFDLKGPSKGRLDLKNSSKADSDLRLFSDVDPKNLLKLFHVNVASDLKNSSEEGSEPKKSVNVRLDLKIPSQAEPDLREASKAYPEHLRTQSQPDFAADSALRDSSKAELDLLDFDDAESGSKNLTVTDAGSLLKRFLKYVSSKLQVENFQQIYYYKCWRRDKRKGLNPASYIMTAFYLRYQCQFIYGLAAIYATLFLCALLTICQEIILYNGEPLEEQMCCGLEKQNCQTNSELDECTSESDGYGNSGRGDMGCDSYER